VVADAPGHPVLRRPARKLARLAREHRLFAALLLGGLAIRTLVQFAYRPALIFPDSVDYLHTVQHLAPPVARPIGYPLFLWVVDGAARSLFAVPVVQHLLGLLIAGLVYGVLLRLGAPVWAAALAAVPALFDAFELNLEQWVLSDTLYTALLLLALVVLVWHPRPSPARCAVSGLLLAAAVLARLDGLVIIAPIVLYAFARQTARRRRFAAAGAALAAFAVPLLGYALWFQAANGSFGLSQYDGLILYGRIARFADCSRVPIPGGLRFLCPTQPLGHREITDWYVWNKKSPARIYLHYPSADSDAVVRAFDLRILEHQPLDYVHAVLADFWHSFALTRAARPTDSPTDAALAFPVGYPVLSMETPPAPSTSRFLAQFGGGPRTGSLPLTRFLHGYQRVIETPGPVVGGLILLGLAGGIAAGRRRRVWPSGPALLFSVSSISVLGVAMATAEFSWRYTIPALPLAPIAGVLGVMALVARRRLSSPAEPIDSPVPRSPTEPPAVNSRGRASR